MWNAFILKKIKHFQYKVNTQYYNISNEQIQRKILTAEARKNHLFRKDRDFYTTARCNARK